MNVNLDKKASQLFPNLPDTYRIPLIDEFNKLIQNYQQGRWEPAEMNAGKFCEVVYSILYCHTNNNFSDGPSKPSNMIDACRQLESTPVSSPRSIRIQIPRMLIALYEIRNNRNVGHIGGDVDPNRMDATVTVQMSKWILCELIRVFHNLSIDEASSVVEAITDRNIPIIWKYKNATRVLNNSLTAMQKMLVLLYYENSPMKIDDLINNIEYKNASQFRTRVLKPAHIKSLIYLDSSKGEAVITPLGVRYVEANIPLEIVDN
jgi:hypothetical protein